MIAETWDNSALHFIMRRYGFASILETLAQIAVEEHEDATAERLAALSLEQQQKGAR